MPPANRIDVHQHVVPPFWADALSAHGGDPSGWHSPKWTPEDAIAFMDSQQIATGVLSARGVAVHQPTAPPTALIKLRSLAERRGQGAVLGVGKNRRFVMIPLVHVHSHELLFAHTDHPERPLLTWKLTLAQDRRGSELCLKQAIALAVRISYKRP